MLKKIALFLMTLMLGLNGPNAESTEWQPLKPLKLDAEKPRSLTDQEIYQKAIRETAAMVGNEAAQKLASQYNLNIINVTWEDTGRYKNSAVGPNISDMTIQVATEDAKSKNIQTALMPVIRYPNFSDKTGDLSPRDFTLLVGNHKGKKLKRISLYDFLENPTAYLSKPQSWRSPKKSLLVERDSKVLVSAQAAFLPVPKKDKATFNPVLFNYQSYSGDPAVLTILATREGTSVTVIDNKRDGFAAGYSWGQRLFHNQEGKRASLTGERFTDFALKEKIPPKDPENHKGMSMVLLIQVPLKQKHPMSSLPLGSSESSCPNCSMAPTKDKSDVDMAVIGHGAYEGPFTEIDNLNIERDPRFPVRVTVQFYKATSNGVVSAEDMKAIAQEIDGVYARSDSVGSLVVAGETGRITEYEGSKVQPSDWWEKFWQRHYDNTGETREVTIQKFIHLMGPNYPHHAVTDLYLRDILRQKNSGG
jgi:hypothetical protein